MNTESVTVLAREYFDKRAGNSYYSAQVYVNNDLAFELVPQYGYGDQYLFEACKELKKRGYLPELEQSTPLSLVCRENNIKLIYNKSEVRRMKDL